MVTPLGGILLLKKPRDPFLNPHSRDFHPVPDQIPFPTVKKTIMYEEIRISQIWIFKKLVDRDILHSMHKYEIYTFMTLHFLLY
jgi:hypothetical protein